MNDARLRFTMNATVTNGDAPPAPSADQLSSGWVRIPVSVQVTLPAELAAGAGQGGSPAGSGGNPMTVSLVPRSLRSGTGSHPDGGSTWQHLDAPFRQPQNDLSAPHAPQGGRDDRRPIDTAALNSLGLDAALRQRLGNRPVAPVGVANVEALRAPPPPDGRKPDAAARGGNQPAAGTGQTPGQTPNRTPGQTPGQPSGTTGNRALDVVFKAGQFGTLHRAPPPSAAAAGPIDAGG